MALKLFPDQTNFDFMAWHKILLAISVIMMLGTGVLLATKGLNLGIDFAGGTLMEIRQPNTAINLPQLRKQMETLGMGEISLQTFADANTVLLRVPQQKGAEGTQQAAIEKIKTTLGAGFDYQRVEFVGPQVGQELIMKGVWAVVLSVIGILFYILVRFQWQFGVASVFALLHDVILTIGLFTLTRTEFNLTTLAAVLMIGGYSINDTVVVFDRVREYLGKFRKKPLPEVLNLSINTTLSRTILTGGTAMLALVALYFLGGPVIQGFVMALLWGIVVGTYSSVFIATPVLLYTNLNRDV